MKTITIKDLKLYLKENENIPDVAELNISDKTFKELRALAKKYRTTCSCYHEVAHHEPRYNVYTGDVSYYEDVVHGECWGTKDCQECRCNGDIKNCTHYPEKRNMQI